MTKFNNAKFWLWQVIFSFVNIWQLSSLNFIILIRFFLYCFYCYIYILMIITSYTDQWSYMPKYASSATAVYLLYCGVGHKLTRNNCFVVKVKVEDNEYEVEVRGTGKTWINPLARSQNLLQRRISCTVLYLLTHCTSSQMRVYAFSPVLYSVQSSSKPS